MPWTITSLMQLIPNTTATYTITYMYTNMVPIEPSAPTSNNNKNYRDENRTVLAIVLLHPHSPPNNNHAFLSCTLFHG